MDKKISNPEGLLDFLEVTIRFELMNNGVADRGLTTWLRHHITFYVNFDILLKSNIRIEDVALTGADYGARTRHLNLGKVALYQMS